MTTCEPKPNLAYCSYKFYAKSFTFGWLRNIFDISLALKIIPNSEMEIHDRNCAKYCAYAYRGDKKMNTDLLRAQLGHFVTVISTSQNAHNIVRLLP